MNGMLARVPSFLLILLSIQGIGTAQEMGEEASKTAGLEALIEDTRSEDFPTRQNAIRVLALEHGEKAIPALMDDLGSGTNPSIRQATIAALTQFPRGVVFPLAAALDSEDEILRRSVILTLGRIQDVRAIPFLQRAAETETNPILQNLAKSRIAELASWAAEKSSHDLFVMLGDAFLNQDPEVFTSPSGPAILWSLDEEGQLHGFTVPTELYSLEMAKMAYGEALQIEPRSEKANLGILRAYAALHEALNEGGMEEAPILAEEVSLALAASGAAQQDTPAIQPAVMTGNLSAVALISAAFGGEETDPASMIPTLDRALGSLDKRIRYSAAITLASLAGQHGTTVSEKVVANLKSALRETSPQVVVVVDENEDRRISTVNYLKGIGCFVVPATDGAEGLVYVKRYGAADLLILSSTLKDLTTNQLFLEIKEDVRTADLPILLLAAEKNQEEIEQEFGGRAAAIVEWGAALAPAVTEHLGTRENPNREAAKELAREAALVISGLNEKQGPIANAAPSLLYALKNHGERIAIPAAHGLGTAGTTAELPALAEIITDGNIPSPIRIAAIRGMGGILSRVEEVPTIAIEALHQVMRGASLSEAKLEAALAIGQARAIQPADRAKVLAEPITLHEASITESTEEGDIEDAADEME